MENGEGEKAENPGADGGPSEKETNKPDSPKPDTQDVAPPLITTAKRECAPLVIPCKLLVNKG